MSELLWSLCEILLIDTVQGDTLYKFIAIYAIVVLQLEFLTPYGI